MVIAQARRDGNRPARYWRAGNRAATQAPAWRSPPGGAGIERSAGKSGATDRISPPWPLLLQELGAASDAQFSRASTRVAINRP